MGFSHRKRISIPKWYDWSFFAGGCGGVIGVFQFLNGTIGVAGAFVPKPTIPVFQFLNGTIGVAFVFQLTH